MRTYRSYKRTVKKLLRPWLRTIRYSRRYARKRPVTTTLLAIGFVLLIFLTTAKVQEHTIAVNRQAYAPLLEVIAKGESGGNYNAYYGHASNETVRFTDMTVSQVMQWQDDFVGQGNPSSAVGKYQIVRSTLAGLVRQLNLNPQARYDEAMQDRLAIALLERRGSVAYVGKQLTSEQFASSISQEWAALPKAIGDNPHQSYYAGDGLNQSRVSLEEIYAALSVLEAGAVTK